MKHLSITAIIIIFLFQHTFAQRMMRIYKDQPDMTISKEEKKKVVDSVISRMNRNYIFPEVAKKMENSLKEKVKKKAYDSITSAKQFAQTLTADLRSISHDKHIGVNYSFEGFNFPKKISFEDSMKIMEEMKAFGRSTNYGFESVKRLPGNIGYLDLRSFSPVEAGGETAIAAMNFVTNTGALIIDLRFNRGGTPEMVSFLSSYFFNERTHLNDLYFRPANETTQFWTQPHVVGQKYINKPIYILTSKETFSAGEEFTYNLKNLKRAIIVGETTGGGAHPGGLEILTSNFGMFLPSGRAINPITKTNWEGVGVEPDIKVNADQALKTAQLDALNQLTKTSKNPILKRELDEAIKNLQSEK